MPKLKLCWRQLTPFSKITRACSATPDEISRQTIAARGGAVTRGVGALLFVYRNGAGEFLRRNAAQPPDFTRDHRCATRALCARSTGSSAVCALDAGGGAW